jgi:chorismate mutase
MCALVVDLLMETPQYLLVESDVAPEVFLKVIEVKNLMASGKAHSVNDAVKQANISRSAFYKYKDKVYPFNDKAGGRIITINAMLKDEPGMLSQLISQFYHYRANILTINQNIPVKGLAPVSVTARIEGITISLEEFITALRTIEGVENIDIVSRM